MPQPFYKQYEQDKLCTKLIRMGVSGKRFLLNDQMDRIVFATTGKDDR